MQYQDFNLDWQPVILPKVVRLPWSGAGILSVGRCYTAVHEEKLLYADWTLDAKERSTALVCPIGWTQRTPLTLPIRLEGNGARLIPSATWLLSYSDALFALYLRANASFSQLIRRIDM